MLPEMLSCSAHISEQAAMETSIINDDLVQFLGVVHTENKKKKRKKSPSAESVGVD